MGMTVETSLLSAQFLPEDNRIMMVEDTNLNRYYWYFRTPGAAPVLGYPIILTDKTANHLIHVFVPIPMGPPILLKVTHTTDTDDKTVVNMNDSH